jgi:hypothetical protein
MYTIPQDFQLQNEHTSLVPSEFHENSFQFIPNEVTAIEPSMVATSIAASSNPEATIAENIR